jgi:hypothetical protein
LRKKENMKFCTSRKRKGEGGGKERPDLFQRINLFYIQKYNSNILPSEGDKII